MSNISRSVYQKVCEENKRMLTDLYILCYVDVTKGTEEEVMAWFDVMHKWHEKFDKDIKLRELTTSAALEYIKEHPELNIQLPSQEKQEP